MMHYHVTAGIQMLEKKGGCHVKIGNFKRGARASTRVNKDISILLAKIDY
jgi:hypothetical protein